MTGRLIEADKLRAWFESHSVWDEFPVGYIMGLIDEQPTVEAIPVEWLKSHMITHGEVVNGDYFEDEALELNMYVSDLIGRWQAEQRNEE